MLLLTDLLSIESDPAACWDLRIRLVFNILMKAISVGSSNVPVCDNVILTCLGILDKYTQYYERPHEEVNEEKLIGKVYKSVDFNEWSRGQLTFSSWMENNRESGIDLFDVVEMQKPKAQTVSIHSKRY
jgi:hypothetical protein